tara:strand:- start:3763 stop:4413 length:651 start_codon:yes stop_codon:yes gene_type:complete
MLFIYKFLKFFCALGLFLCSLALLFFLMEGETTEAYIVGAVALLLLWPYLKYKKLIANKTKENKEKEEREQKVKERESYNKYVAKFGEEYSPDKETETQTLIEGMAEAWEREAALKAFRYIKQQKEEALIENYRAEFGDDIVSSYLKREVRLGMTKQMIIEMHGEPDEIKRERTEKNLTEDCFYAKPGTKYLSGKTSTFKLKVKLLNGIVKEFKEY